jgi:predicted permease
VLGFTTAVSVLTAALFGLAPAFRATGFGPAPALQDNTRGSLGFRGRLIAGLVTAQVAMSLLLLVGGGLFLRTLQNLRSFDPGFRSEGVLVASVSGARLGYRGEQAMTFYLDLLRQVQETPGVASASFSSLTPLSGSGISNQFFVNGQPIDRHETPLNRIGPGYFETLRTPMLLGRDFTFQDDSKAARVAIVNEAFAGRYFAGDRPLGRHLSTRGPAGEIDMEVVGVVRNTNYDNLRESLEPIVYTPYLQGGTPFTTYEVYATSSVSDVASRLRTALQSRIPGSVMQVRTLTSQVEQTLVKERLMATLAAGFAGLALALASLGLYGMLAYAVSRRTNEIGIRMAIGARRQQVLRLVLGDAVRMLLAGVLLGLPTAWAGSRLITSMLFNLTPTDPTTISAATGVLIGAGFIAALAPALRASRIDPIAALRHE